MLFSRHDKIFLEGSLVVPKLSSALHLASRSPHFPAAAEAAEGDEGDEGDEGADFAIPDFRKSASALVAL